MDLFNTIEEKKKRRCVLDTKKFMLSVKKNNRNKK